MPMLDTLIAPHLALVVSIHTSISTTSTDVDTDATSRRSAEEGMAAAAGVRYASGVCYSTWAGR